MTRIVRLREEADQDLATAAAWYERQRADLGQEFLSEALTAISGFRSIRLSIALSIPIPRITEEIER